MVELEVTEEWDSVRIDAYLHILLEAQQLSYSRSQIQKLLRIGKATHNGNVLKPSTKLVTGDRVCLEFPPEFLQAQQQKKSESENHSSETSMGVLPEKIPLEVLYEDEDILVVNKPKGMAVHGSSDERPQPPTTGTLVNGLLYHCMDAKGMVHLSAGFPEYTYRPGIVHRIDKQSSGAVVVAKNMEAHEGLKEQFEQHSIIRKYQCLCHGAPSKSNGRIVSLLGRHPTMRTRQTVLRDLSDYPTENLPLLADQSEGQLARSAWTKLESFVLPTARERERSPRPQVSWLEVELFTGRTHQIRVQMQRLALPLLFDPLYRSYTPRRTEAHLPHKLTKQEDYLFSHVDGPEFDSEGSLYQNDPVRRVGQILHASSLSFIHPVKQTPMSFQAPPPPYFQRLLNILRKCPK